MEIIVDPNNYDKKIAYQQAIDLCNFFLAKNNISVPKYRIFDRTKLRGYYNKGQITIRLKGSPSPVKKPGWRWSYTGYKADLTIPGVIAHELGHYVDDYLKLSNVKSFHDICYREAPVSSYEPTMSESFAEAMKLFILNPDLLKCGRPERYTYISNYLKPITNLLWKDILVNAHPKLISTAESWITK